MDVQRSAGSARSALKALRYFSPLLAGSAAQVYLAEDACLEFGAQSGFFPVFEGQSVAETDGVDTARSAGIQVAGSIAQWARR
jgi:hypothetical protein